MKTLKARLEKISVKDARDVKDRAIYYYRTDRVPFDPDDFLPTCYLKAVTDFLVKEGYLKLEDEKDV